MTIMYLTFGDKTEYHVQAYLSMLSFRKQLLPTDRIVMVTTRPQYYRHAEGWAQIVAISEAQTQQWEGPHRYMFRVKTMALLRQAEQHPSDHLIFVDTDTFLFGSLAGMRALLDGGTGLMHRDEGHPSQMKGPSLRMWKQVAGRTYGGICLGPGHNMWNSGIIAMPKDKMLAIARDTLALLDGMLDDGVKSFNIEQYAMSVAMQAHVALKEGTAYVGHYWGNKDEWGRLAAELLLRAYMQESSPDEEMQAITGELLRSKPVFVHHSDTARRIGTLVGRLFPDRDARYIGETE